MQNNYGRVLENTWKDNDVVVVGGGPSVQSFDTSLFSGRCALLVNDALLSFSDLLKDRRIGVLAVTSFTLDNRWVRRHRSFLSHWEGEKYVALPLETWPGCRGIPGVTYLQWGYEKGLSEDPAFINTGGNSGYGALNLAYFKHPRRIFLVGYDMDPSAHFAYPSWIRYFRTTVPQFEARGIQVINLNPNSGIDAFPKSTCEAVRRAPANPVITCASQPSDAPAVANPSKLDL